MPIEIYAHEVALARWVVRLADDHDVAERRDRTRAVHDWQAWG